MKRYFYFLLFLSLSATAQISKNQAIWTASLNPLFSNVTQASLSNPRFDLQAKAEANFFIRDGLALGLTIQGNWTDLQTLNGNSTGFKYQIRNRSVSLMPFIRKYWALDPVIVYAGGGINLTNNKNSGYQQINYILYHDDKTNINQITPQTQLGIIYPFTKKLGVHLSAQSDLYPISFNSLQLGLVVLTGAKDTGTKSEDLIEDYPLAKGRWLLTGTFNSSVKKESRYNSDTKTRNEYRSPSTFISIGSGLFLRDRLLVGVDLYTALDNLFIDQTMIGAYASQEEKKPFLIGIRPYVKKYFLPTRLSPYIQGTVSYNRTMTGKPATNTFYGGVDFGLAYILGKNWLLEGKLLGMNASYSSLPSQIINSTPFAGINKFSANVDAGFQPAFTLAYSLH